MQTVADPTTLSKPRAYYAQFHGLAGVITKPTTAVLFLESASGAVVTLTVADEPHLVVLGEVEAATAQYVQDMAAGRAAVVCGRQMGRA
jgi:hypothetical protein